MSSDINDIWKSLQEIDKNSNEEYKKRYKNKDNYEEKIKKIKKNLSLL